MASIFYKVTLEEPTIFSALEGEPNSAVSDDYIPGSVMRGLLIGEYRSNPIDDYTGDFSQHPLFFSDDVLFLNATVAINDGHSNPRKTYVTPTSWRKFKYNDDSKVYDNAVAQMPMGEKASRIGGYTYSDNKVGQIVKPERVLNVHTQRRRRKIFDKESKKWRVPVDQQVYRYDALAKGQVFVGEIRCNTGEQEAKIRQLLDKVGRAAIGGARSAGYGQVCISVLEGEPDGYIEPKLIQPSDGQWVITILSDTILRDANGKFSSITDTLLANLNDNGITCAIENVKLALLSTRMVGGFNRKWGLPLPQMSAIEQGSVLVLESHDEHPIRIDNAKVNAMLAKGLGERRNEGFGQIAINWQQQAILEREKHDPMTDESSTPQNLSDNTESMTTILRERVTSQQFDSYIVELVHGRNSSKQVQLRGSISATQIARLRSVIRDNSSNSEELYKAIEEYLDKTVKGKVAEQQLKNSSIGGVKMDAWLRQIVAGKLPNRLQLSLADVILKQASQTQLIEDLRLNIDHQLKQSNSNPNIINEFLNSMSERPEFDEQFLNVYVGIESVPELLSKIVSDKMPVQNVSRIIDMVLDHAQKTARQQEKQGS